MTKSDRTKSVDIVPSRADDVLAQLLVYMMRDESEQARMVALSRAGFSNVEIANLMGKQAGVVKQQLYLARKAAPQSTAVRSKKR